MNSDKFYCFAIAGAIVAFAMWLKLPEASNLANILVAGILGSVVGEKLSTKS